MQETSFNEFPYGLADRIPGFHPGGQAPGMGNTIVVFVAIFNDNNDNNNNNNKLLK